MLKKKGKTIVVLLVVALTAVIAAVWVCTPEERVTLFVQFHNEVLAEIASACLAGA